MPLRKDPLPRTSGIMTFATAPRGELDDLEKGMVAVAGVPYDFSGPSRLGAKFGPWRLRETSNAQGAAALGGGGTIDIDTRKNVDPTRLHERLRDLGDILIYPIQWEQSEETLREAMYQIATRGALPIILGGDHYITYSLVQGFKDAVIEGGGKKVGYIQFSSQLDLGDEDPVWGRVWRGATARRIIDGGMADTRNMVWVGTNGYVRSEQWELAQELGLTVFTLDDIRRDGIASVTQQAIEIAGDDCDSIYLSVDFDVLDGGYVAQTATPAFDGITNVDLTVAIDVLTESKVGAMDLCGLNPFIEAQAQGETGQRFGAILVMRFIYPRIMSEA